MEDPSTFYHELDIALTVSGVTSSAAEVHGAIAGILCACPDLKTSRGLEVLRDTLGNVSESCIVLLDGLFVATGKALMDEQFKFYPLLPDDETALAIRAEALAHWCRGFLYGFGLMGARSLPKQGQEILRDFTQISQLDPEVEGEEDETAFAELVEFVRVCAQLLSAESFLTSKKEHSNG